MSKGSSRRPEDAGKIANNWDKIFGKSYDRIIVDELKEPEEGLYPYEMQRKMNELAFPNKMLLPSKRSLVFDDKVRSVDSAYSIKEEMTAEQKQEAFRLMNIHYGL